MSGFLSRLTGGQGSEAGAQNDGSAIAPPVPSFGHASRALLLESLENSNLGWFWASDAKGRLVYISQPAAQRIGKPAEEIVGKSITKVFLPVEGGEDTGHERPLKFQLAARNSIKPVTVRLEIGKTHSWWEIAGVPQLDAEGNFGGYHGIARDVSDTYTSKRDAEKMSRYDSLTGLSNRHRMSQQLNATLTGFKASKRSCAMMLIDLDRFKQVNDTMGHPAGDELLKQVSARLKRILGDEVELGRIGGDEFQVIMPDQEDRGVLGDYADRVIQMVSQPYSINGMRAVIGASVGIAVAPFDGIDDEELVKAADLALYAAKGGGRGQFRFYSADLRDKASYRHQIESDLRDAIERDELEMHYQPIVSAKTHQVACVEALMRWNHTDRGMISPADFIPIAEEVGIIRELGEWALIEVCKTIQSWPGDVIGAVNVSAVQFASDDFVDIVQRALITTGIEPGLVELEITESVFVGDMDRALRVFTALKDLGVRLSLDDFGTGYSSLGYLRDAPFDKIKIDQSFVRGCTAEDSKNDAIIAAVVSLSRALGMDTVRRIGCGHR